MYQLFVFHNIGVKITCGVIKSWWDERIVLASNMPQACVTAQGPLWPGRPCWVDTLMTLWLAVYPCVCWPNGEGISLLQQCTRKHYKMRVFLNVFTICFDRYQSMQFSHLLFCIFITVFLSSDLSWPFYLRCHVSCLLNFNYRHVVLFTVLTSGPRFHSACIIFRAPLPA